MPTFLSLRPRSLHRALALVGLTAAGFSAAPALRADALSRKTEVDFFRDIASRDLHGLATRSDGRLVGGPTLTELKGDAPAELLWCLEPTPQGTWLVGTGPGGRIFEVTARPDSYASQEVAKLAESQVFAVKRLPDGSLLAGTSPKGALCLIRGGKTVARVALPVDSIFDLLLLGDGTALAATGNPGRIYRIDLAKFAQAGVTAEKVSDAKGLAARGILQFGEIRDRNVRRLARLTDGRIAAGSSPRGNVYLFPPAGGAPFLAQENHDAEVTDLLPDSAGGFYAALVFSTAESHLSPVLIKPRDPTDATPSPVPTSVPAQIEKFTGRSALVWFPPDGFPETLTTRGGAAFYRLARQGPLVLIAGGEQGEMIGYDPGERLALTFAGSTAAQVNGLAPIPGSPGRFLALHNNAAGFALVDFASAGPRRAETRPIDLGNPGRLGAVRFDRLRDLAPSQLTVAIASSNAADEAEGWSPWVALADQDGWRGPGVRGRYVKLRLELPATAPASLQVDKAAVYVLPQNHRPVLQEFRLLSANFAVVVPPETPAPVVTTVAQLLASGEGEKRRNGFLSSQIVASPGTRVAFWTVNDADGDNLAYTFSLRREGDPAWTDLLVDGREAYTQFDTLHLPEGTYFTRLVAREIAPRTAADRLTVSFETDNLIVDHTPPQILEATARRDGDRVIITVHGRDALSLLDSLEVVFNNGVREVVEQPADGVLDGREETFVLEERLGKIAGATSAEITLYDSADNGATRRLTW
jgi:hypothetical protein